MSDAIASTRKIPTLSLSEYDFYVTTHFERDNRNVDLYVRYNVEKDDQHKAILSWTDDEVDEAVEDGFLKATDWLGTAFKYAKDTGFVEKIETEANERLARIWNPVLDAATTFEDADIDSDADDLIQSLPAEIRKDIDLLPYGMREVLEEEIKEILDLTVGWQIVGPDGYNIHGEEDDAFGMDSFDILNGEAIKTARAWVAENPGYAVTRVGRDDVEEPRYLDTISLAQVGWQLVGPDGGNVQGEAADPFGLNPNDVLIDGAVDIAREWVSRNPGYSVVRVSGSFADEQCVDQTFLRSPAPKTPAP